MNIQNKGATIHLINRCIYVYSYDPVTWICTWQVGLSDNMNWSNIVLNQKPSNEPILRNRLSPLVCDVFATCQQTTKHNLSNHLVRCHKIILCNFYVEKKKQRKQVNLLLRWWLHLLNFYRNLFHTENESRRLISC